MRKWTSYRLQDLPVTKYAVTSSAVNCLQLSKEAHELLEKLLRRKIHEEDYSEVWTSEDTIPRNAAALVHVVKKLGKRAGEEIELVPLKKGVRYVVLTDGDGAFESIHQDHLVWSLDKQWVMASELNRTGSFGWK